MAQWRTDSYEFKTPHNVHLFEMMMLADQYGQPTNGANFTGQAVDAFGRARFSQPFTLFDSFHRYGDNNKFVESNSVSGASSSFNSYTATIDLQLDANSGSFIKRESTRVFAYQPGKSLQILHSFVMAPAKEGLRQRVGYFGLDNGIFLEQENTTISFVRRSQTTGTVVDTKVARAAWNRDRLDGTGPSKKTLDLTKAQILFIDIEWLGVGSVRAGFIIDGVFIECHIFHHANIQANPYMTTACLPIRSEIENIADTSSASILKLVCATVISEGGHESTGKSLSAGHAITLPYSMATANTLYPLISMRLKSSRLDAIVDPKTFSVGIGTDGDFQYQLITGGLTTGGQWISAGNTSAVEYNLTANSITNGTVRDRAYINASKQFVGAPQNVSTPFKFQLERNSLANTSYEFILALVGANNNRTAWGALQWEEIT